MTTLEPRTNLRPGSVLMRVGANPTAESAPRSLAEAVGNAVRALERGTLQPVASPKAGPAYQPEGLLALMVFCYARGIYSSAAMEDLFWRDRQLRELVGNDVPSAKVLRRFRRSNREALHRCLIEALRYLAGADSSLPSRDLGREVTLADEVHRRIAKAMFIDQMESDDADF